MVKKAILLSLFAVSCMASLLAQPADLPVFKQVSHPFMPPITSTYFFFSEDGFIWFSTARGLTSFDGSELVYYSKLQQADTFFLNNITAITEDKNHNFYIATPVSLVYYDRKSKIFTKLPYTFTDTHSEQKIFFNSLYIDRSGLVYAGSINNGLFV